MKVIKGLVDLTSANLKELPDLSDVIVYGNFICYNNKLTSLKGAPEEVHVNFYCWNNLVKFTEEQVRAVCKVRGKIYT